MFAQSVKSALHGAGRDEVGGPADSRPSKRILLLVVDDSEEFHVALRWASRRAMHTGSRIGLLYVMERPEAGEWISVQYQMRADAREEAESMLQQVAAECYALSGLVSVFFLREGDKQEEIIALVEEEPNIAVLVLGAGKGPSGPGPLVSTLVGKMSGSFEIPILVVPSALRDDVTLALS